MTTPAWRWLLEHPLNSADGGIPEQYISRTVQPDGSLLTVTLAVDR